MKRLLLSFFFTTLLLGISAAQTATPSEPVKTIPKPAQKPAQPPASTPSTTHHTAAPNPAQPVKTTPVHDSPAQNVVYSSGNSSNNNSQQKPGDVHTPSKPPQEPHSNHIVVAQTGGVHSEHPHETVRPVSENYVKHQESENSHPVTNTTVAGNVTTTNTTYVTPVTNNTAPARSYTNNNLVDLNKGTSAEIDSVFGDRRGHHVIEGRPYKEVRELLTRNIIPGEEYLAIRDLVTVGSSTYTREVYPANSINERPTAITNPTSTTRTVASTGNIHEEEEHHYKKVDLNKASRVEIDHLFGYEHGKRVIEARPYKEVHELVSRHVVSEEKYHEVKYRVYVSTANTGTHNTAGNTQTHSTTQPTQNSQTTTQGVQMATPIKK